MPHYTIIGFKQGDTFMLLLLLCVELVLAALCSIPVCPLCVVPLLSQRVLSSTSRLVVPFAVEAEEYSSLVDDVIW